MHSFLLSAADLPIHLHTLPSFAHTRTLRAHTKGISHLAFSNNSAFLASASDDRTIRIWDLAKQPQSGTPSVDGGGGEGSARVLRGHLSAVFCVAWGPRDDLVASGGMDETVRVWDVQKGELVWRGGLGSSAYAVELTFGWRGRQVYAGPASALGSRVGGRVQPRRDRHTDV